MSTLPKPFPELYKFLKKQPTGPEAYECLMARTLMHLGDNNEDPMVLRVLDRIKDIKASQILDVGCYSGWLYHYLGKPKGYTGLDTWETAIQVAKALFPEGDFRLMDVMDFKERVEFVWCSQIIWKGRLQEAMAHLRSIGERGTVLLVKHEAERVGPFEDYGALGIIRW